jgi:hypothetical protein
MVNPSLPGAAFGYGSTKKPEQTKSFVSEPSQNLSVFEPIPMATSGNVAKVVSSLGAPQQKNMSAGVNIPNVNKQKTFFNQADPVSMDAMVDVGGGQQKTQYRNLTDLMKMNMDSLSGKIRIRDDRFPDRKAYVPPGYDSDMVPFAVKISAARLGMDPKEYMDMSIMDRVKNFGTEARSMGQELTTGVGQAIDAGKQLVSNLPMMSLLSGFLGSGGGEQQTTPGNIVNTDNTGIMSNVTFPPERPESSSLIQTEDARPISFTGQYGGRGLENILSELGLSSEAEYRHYLTLSPEAQKQFLRMNPEMRKGYMSKI